jgi:hypothetical protein
MSTPAPPRTGRLGGGGGPGAGQGDIPGDIPGDGAGLPGALAYADGGAGSSNEGRDANGPK